MENSKRYAFYTNSTLPDFEGTVDEFVYWLFNHRCVTCKRSATEIGHIVPKGRGREFKDDWKNMVPQCSQCHTLSNTSYHSRGVTDDKIKELQDARKSFLIALGREKFI